MGGEVEFRGVTTLKRLLDFRFNEALGIYWLKVWAFVVWLYTQDS